MIQVKGQTDNYVSQFERLEKALVADGHSWLLPIRKAAISRFAELGFPTTRDEEWRFTNVSAIAATEFEFDPGEPAAVSAQQLGACIFDDNGCHRLVFVNGSHRAELSAVGALPDGVRVESLAAALRGDTAMLEQNLGRYATDQRSAFLALNTAFLADGAIIHIGKGQVVEKPIHLVFVSTTPGRCGVSYPRNLIVADSHAQATIVESHVSLADAARLTVAVTEIVAGDGAVIDHYKCVRESEQAFHMGTLQVHQRRSSNVRSQTITLGGAITRNDINALLDGEGCECTLNGLAVLDGKQHVDNHLRVEHAKPHCNSWEYFKGIYDDQARGVFTGRIVVHEGAQKTDAKQTNMNLLLSDEALADSLPQLEIFADDVKCTHGATVGQVDDEAIFYLRSRGITKDAARSLLVYAFAGESIDQIRVPALRDYVREHVLSRLPQGGILRGVV